MPRPKQFVKAEVLEKAKNLFWKQGYHATSMQNLVDHLGINRASLYAAFGSKNELYESAFQAYKREGQAYVHKLLSAQVSAKFAIRTLFLNAVTDSLDDPDRKGCFIVNCTTEYLPLHPHILSDLLENKKYFETLISQTIKQGQDEGEINSSICIADTAAYLFTFFSGLRVIAKVEKDPKVLRKSVEVGLRVLD